MATGVTATLEDRELGQALGNYSFQEDATPVNISDTSAGVGQITLDVTDFPDSDFSFDRRLKLTDPVRGNTTGIVREVSSDKSTGRCSMTADSLLSMFNATRRAFPIMTRNIVNLIPNPTMGVGIAGYSGNPGTGGAGSLTRNAANIGFGVGTASFLWSTASTAVGGGIYYQLNNAISAGRSYAFSTYVFINKAQRMQIQVQWRDGDGNLLDTTGGAAVVVPNSASTRLSYIGVAPARAVSAWILIYSAVGTSGTTWAAGNRLQVDALMVTEGTLLYDFRDGTYPDWTWTANADESASVGTPSIGGAPVLSTLEDAWRYYATTLCEMPANQVAIDPSLASIPVVIPGWEGNVWDKMREMATVYRAEIVLLDGAFGATATLRPIRQRSIATDNASQFSRSVSIANYANYVEVINQKATQKGAGLAYPESGYRYDGTVLQVASGETIRQRFKTTIDLVSVNQPIMMEKASPIPYLDGAGPGMYCVIGNDGLPLKPEFWKQYGGSVTVSLTENPFEIEVTVQGPVTKLNSPYRLAESDGKTTYPALYITGNGVHTEPETFRSQTGVPVGKTSTELGATIDSPFITDAAKMYTAAIQAVQAFSSPKVTISGGLPSYNDSVNQFGQAVGSRLTEQSAKYRVSTTTFGPSGFTAGAALDVIGSDFAAIWSGKTGAQFKAKWGSTPGKYFAIEPLRLPL